ncbi:MAG: Rrf2 family transcriptional regulator [Phycisphaerales bacterium]
MFSQTAEYAMRAMAYLALTPNELLPTSVLAKHTKVPLNYLAKVLQQLGNARLIVGRRGVGGGYRLARPAKDIRLLEVINAVTTVARITTCPLGISTHGTNLCPLHRKADEAAAAVIRVFDGTTLLDLISQPGANTPLCETKSTAQLTVSASKR